MTGRLVALLVALVGLFAMHGLSDHGAAGHLEGAGVVVAAHHSTPSHAPLTDLESMSSTSEPVVGAVAAAMPSGMGGPGHDLGTAGLCLAVMAVGLLLAAAVRHAWADNGPGRLLSLPSVGAALRPRAPDPPDLVQLSVQRC